MSDVDNTIEGIISSINLEPIIGKSFSQICVGKYDVCFDFQLSPIKIMSKNRIDIFKNNSLSVSWNYQTGWSNTNFRDIIDCDVTSYNKLYRSIEIFLEGNFKIVFYVEPPYESLSVWDENSGFSGYYI